MKNRTVAHILESRSIEMGRTRVKQPLPTQRVERVSPFLLLHHFGPEAVEPGVDPLDVGPHPHRGFEPVTFLYSGRIRHKDSRGNEGLLQEGDVQWMTAGMGIIHSERASKAFLESGGIMEGIQLWVNLPGKFKMVQPRYQDIKSADIPLVKTEHAGLRLELVAGQYRGQQGPAKTYTPVLALKASFRAGSDHFFEIPSQYNSMAYVLNGEVALKSGFAYGGETLLHFKNDGEGFHLKANTEARVLVLAGAPIDEPLAQWGPYVMNTQTEVMQAVRDYQMGKMGVYID